MKILKGSTKCYPFFMLNTFKRCLFRFDGHGCAPKRFGLGCKFNCSRLSWFCPNDDQAKPVEGLPLVRGKRYHVRGIAVIGRSNFAGSFNREFECVIRTGSRVTLVVSDSHGNKRQVFSVSADDITAVVGMSKELTVFELQKAIGGRDLKRASEIMERMLDAGGSVPYIIIMLTGYFSTLYRLHDLRRRNVPQEDLASEARVNPYFLREYLDAVGRVPVHEIERAFEILVEADEQSKTGSADPRQVMQFVLAQLLG